MTIRLVDNVLIFHDGPILEFKLVSEHACNEAISRWMLILSRNRIRYLDLRFNGRERCEIPSRLFCCLALERVILSDCIINVAQSFQGFKLLHTLSLLSFNLSGIATIANLVSGCPLLERLRLYNFVQQGCLHIIAPNLRDLDIWGECHDLCLETPKLISGRIYLNISNGDHKKFLIANSGKESNIKKALGCLPNIQELHIDAEFGDYLAMGPIPENPPTIFNCLTEISLAAYCSDREEIAVALCLFKSAPILNVLNIEFLDWRGEDQLQGQPFWRLKASVFRL
ncbi:hypothetical protein LUZ63_000541 [Rhynchospora breviuscula]|uniref:F-box/LRR-repeat protein 15/At3g58940/PEG3-like LRR domain-containing protein n=1 Tax=Rhynchospora breviuscula TaxID=2022672 RepID=A0A9Q0CW25_9POAL|nr:hypothetical protein LUZ63_000541 [Rhynchospora breviuscula]